MNAMCSAYPNIKPTAGFYWGQDSIYVSITTLKEILKEFQRWTALPVFFKFSNLKFLGQSKNKIFKVENTFKLSFSAWDALYFTN